ncbi:MAG: hypothetical protein EP329_28270 [Deltaproteobacteria bacterium]|nr:MAG: hypothetical protein EP329_28270 [Deltaproteobacteria bacterium]
MNRPLHRVTPLLLLAAATLLACSDDAGGGGATTLAVTTTATAGAAEAGTTVTATVTLKSGSGAGLADVALSAEVTRGGGVASTETLTTNADGVATLTWTLGLAPVDNTLSVVTADGEAGTATVRATIGEEPQPVAFGDVDAFLTDLGRSGSTEGLTFSADGTLLIGVPEGLAAVDPDGTAHAVNPGGAGIAHPLGLAAGADGATWVCDSDAHALVKVGANGLATVVVDHDGDDPLETPNSVALGPDGLVYLTDSCLGRVLQIDPATGDVLSRIQMDLATEGSPNGVAFDDDGALWFTTENTALLCGHDGVELTAPIAGLFKVEIGADGLGAPVAVVTGVGLFGDGLAFDVEGNLYAIFDTAEGLALDESIVFVLPKGATTLTRWFGVRGLILANLAFGQGAYGETTLYFSLLSVTPFVPAEARGLVTLPAGLAGRPLP